MGSNIDQIRFKTQKGIGFSFLFTEWYPATSKSSLSIKKFRVHAGKRKLLKKIKDSNSSKQYTEWQQNLKKKNQLNYHKS